MKAQAKPWAPAMAQMRRAWRTSPLPGFISWWGDELRALLPARMRGWSRSRLAWYRLHMDADGPYAVLQPAGTDGEPVRIDLRQAAALQQAACREALAGIDPRDLRVALCLPDRQVLRRALRLPAAARGDLRRVVGFDMDRQTPFRLDEVCFDVHETGSVSDGQLPVELLLAPKVQVQALLERAHALGVTVDAVDVATAGGRMGLNLLAAEQRPRHRDRRGRLNAILLGVAGLLLFSIMGQWLHNRRMLLEDMRAQVQTLRTQARQVAALRNQWTSRMHAAGFLAGRRAHTPTMLALLGDLTRRLPDDTWLERLGVDSDGHVTLQGQSPHATALLKLLADSAYLRDPGFEGSIQADPASGKEHFVISARLRRLADPVRPVPPPATPPPAAPETPQRSVHAQVHAR